MRGHWAAAAGQSAVLTMAGAVVNAAGDCPVHWVMLAGCRFAGGSLPRGRWRWWARRVCGAGSRRTRRWRSSGGRSRCPGHGKKLLPGQDLTRVVGEGFSR